MDATIEKYLKCVDKNTRKPLEILIKGMTENIPGIKMEQIDAQAEIGACYFALVKGIQTIALIDLLENVSPNHEYVSCLIEGIQKSSDPKLLELKPIMEQIITYLKINNDITESKVTKEDLVDIIIDSRESAQNKAYRMALKIMQEIAKSKESGEGDMIELNMPLNKLQDLDPMAKKVVANLCQKVAKLLEDDETTD